jgi:Flp pilus assembly CpaF family ATPase
LLNVSNRCSGHTSPRHGRREFYQKPRPVKTLGFETILPFLPPIEHLFRDDSVSQIMANGSNRVFIEREGVLQHVSDLTLSAKSLMVAVKNIARRLGDDISEAKPILDSRVTTLNSILLTRLALSCT